MSRSPIPPTLPLLAMLALITRWSMFALSCPISMILDPLPAPLRLSGLWLCRPIPFWDGIPPAHAREAPITLQTRTPPPLHGPPLQQATPERTVHGQGLFVHAPACLPPRPTFRFVRRQCAPASASFQVAHYTEYSYNEPLLYASGMILLGYPSLARACQVRGRYLVHHHRCITAPRPDRILRLLLLHSAAAFCSCPGLT
ncbi:hypothetical protein J3F83DRAFT_764930 [Trichoderma novae-zelandiae]